MTKYLTSFCLSIYIIGITMSVNAAKSVTGTWSFDKASNLYASPETGLKLRGKATPTAKGIVGGGIHFDGKNQYLCVVLPEANRPRKEMTLAFWYKAEPGTQRFPAVRHVNTTFAVDGNSGFSWYQLNTENGGHYYNGYAHPERLKAGKWYHFAMVYSQKELAVYLNGRKISKASVRKGGVIRNTSQPVNIGGRMSRSRGKWTGFFKGTMDEIQILNYAQKDFPRVRVLIIRENLRLLNKKLKSFSKKAKLTEARADAVKKWQQELKDFEEACENTTLNDKVTTLSSKAVSLEQSGLQLYRKLTMLKAFGEKTAKLDFTVAVVSPLRRVIPDNFILGKSAALVKISLAANERENKQLMVFPTNSGVKKLEVKLPETLTRKDGTAIPFQIKISKVVFSKLIKPSPYMYQLSVIPDRLLPATNFDLSAKPMTLLWLEVKAPHGTKSGIYRGNLKLKTVSGGELELPLQVKVWGFELPKRNIAPSLVNIWERDLQTYIKVGDTEKFIELLEAYAEMLLEHRLNPVIMAHHGLVAGWLRKSVYPNYRVNAEGKAEINWKYFDRIIKKLRSKGLSRIVVGPHYNFDKTKLGGGNWLKNIQNTKPEVIWKAIDKHVKAKGYLKDAVAYPIDEPQAKVHFINTISKILKTNAPKIKFLVTSGAANYPNEKLHGVDIWVPLFHWTNFIEKKKIQQKGIAVWNYVCTGPNYPNPNLHSDTPATAIRMVPVGAMRFGYDGFLHWAANFNTYKNVSEKVINAYAAGEGTYIYADKNGYPVSSIRLKILADGMEDWTAFLMLKKLNRRSWRRMKAKLAILIPARKFDKKMKITLKSPKEASFKTFLKPDSFYNVYDKPKRFLKWRNELYTLLEAASK